MFQQTTVMTDDPRDIHAIVRDLTKAFDIGDRPGFQAGLQALQRHHFVAAINLAVETINRARQMAPVPGTPEAVAAFRAIAPDANLPWRSSGEEDDYCGCIFDAADKHIITVDDFADRDDADVTAITNMIIIAVNTCAGFHVEMPTAEARGRVA